MPQSSEIISDFGEPIFRTVYYKELLLLFQPLIHGFTLQYLIDMHPACCHVTLSFFCYKITLKIKQLDDTKRDLGEVLRTALYNGYIVVLVLFFNDPS